MNDLQILPRMLAPTLEAALREFPVVVLTGARQTGKTTLATRLPSAGNRLFRSLDDLRVMEQAERDPDVLVGEAERMTIDEVQRAPSLLLAIKRAVDRRRTRGRFLLTGSANLLLLRGISESLAGRAVYLRLGPMTEPEKAGVLRSPAWSELLQAGNAADAAALLRARRPGPPVSWLEAACQGGYPPVLDLGVEARARWLESYVTTYIERDLQQLASISALSDFRRLLEVAALRIGGIVNQADLARDAGLSRPTAHRYLGLLEVSFQARMLRPYAVSRTKRLVKAPKLYWGDTGMVAHLAGVGEPAAMATAAHKGAFLENLLLHHIDVWRETVAPRPEVFYWRTAAGTEVDLVIEHRRRLLPLEAKTSTSIRTRDAANLERFLDDYDGAAFGLIAHLGDDIHPVTPRVVAVPVDRLW